MIKEFSPETERLVALYNEATAPFWPLFMSFVEAAASSLQLSVTRAQISSRGELASVIRAHTQPAHTALVIFPAAMFTNNRDEIIELINRSRAPAIYSYRFWAANGGLMSYGVDVHDLFRRAASYVALILRGRPAIDGPTKVQVQSWLWAIRSSRLMGGLLAKVALGNAVSRPCINCVEDVEIGGLMSYGPEQADHWVRAAAYVDKLLKGARPSDCQSNNLTSAICHQSEEPPGPWPHDPTHAPRPRR